MNILSRKKVFALVSFFIFFIFFLNFSANKFYWYSSIWWFDLMMHFLGGLWLGLFFIWYDYENFVELNFNKKNLLNLIYFVLFVGIAWEIYEILVNILFAQNSFDAIDTFTDLIADTFGGVIIFIFLKKLKISYNK